MVRVGGGWDTLQHYLYKHDQCRQQHEKLKPAKKVSHHETPLMKEKI